MAGSGADLAYRSMLSRAGKTAADGLDAAALEQIILEALGGGGTSASWIIEDPAYTGIQQYIGSSLPADPTAYANCLYLVLPSEV